MSMRYYPIEAYGLLAYPADLQAWWDRETDGYGTPAFKQEAIALHEVEECLPAGDCTEVLDCEGNVYRITEKGIGDEPTFGCYGEDFVILNLGTYPSLFYTAYENRQAAIDWLKKTYGQVLPEDFDYDGRFVYYSGVDFG